MHRLIEYFWNKMESVLDVKVLGHGDFDVASTMDKRKHKSWKNVDKLEKACSCMSNPQF